MNVEERRQAIALRDYVVFCAASGRSTPVLLSKTEREQLKQLKRESEDKG